MLCEPTPARRPSRCLACARVEAANQTLIRQAQEDRLRDFDGCERHVFLSDVPVPHQWYVDVKQAARRHPEAINPGGLVEVFQKDRHIKVEICPPKEKPETWRPENVLYLLRYLSKKPLVFRAVPIEESQSPLTWHALRKRWHDTLTTPVLSKLKPHDVLSEGMPSEDS
jgi:hypothetical protein